MKIEEYLKERVDDQITYFEKKSKCNKNHYYLLTFISVICSIVASSIMTENFIIICQILSISVALSIGLESLCRFKDKWIIYRNTAELLKSEKIKFQTRKDVAEDTEKEFVDKIEEILTRTNNEWRELATKSDDKN